MAKFSKGDMVISKTGKEYLVTNVFDDSKPDLVRGQRYGIYRIKNGERFGPFRNFYDNSDFKLMK